MKCAEEAGPQRESKLVAARDQGQREREKPLIGVLSGGNKTFWN